MKNTRLGRRLTRLSVIPLMLFAISGCSSMDSMQDWLGIKQGEDVRELPQTLGQHQFIPRWRAEVGASRINLLTPAIASDAIYAASGDGVLTAVNRINGKPLWQQETGVNISGGVGFGEGRVLVGSDKGELLAYSSQGTPVWKVQLSSEVLNAPQVSDGVVLVRTGDGMLSGLSVVDGVKLWSYQRSNPALVVRSHAGATIQRGIAYVGFAAGKLAAVRITDGMVQWEVTVSQPRGNTELERISDITSPPVVDDVQVCAVAFQGQLACYDIAQGRLLWNRDVSSDKGMMLLRKYLYVTDSEGVIHVLDKNTGSVLWRSEALRDRETTAPYVIADYVVVGDYQGYLHMLNREDGQPIGRIRLGNEIDLPAQRLDSDVLVLTRGGSLHALGLH